MSTVGKAPTHPNRAKVCSECIAYLTFRRECSSAIDASDRVEYAVHLIVRHGFVR